MGISLLPGPQSQLQSWPNTHKTSPKRLFFYAVLVGLGSTIAVSAIITVNALRFFLFLLPIRGFHLQVQSVSQQGRFLIGRTSTSENRGFRVLVWGFPLVSRE